MVSSLRFVSMSLLPRLAASLQGKSRDVTWRPLYRRGKIENLIDSNEPKQDNKVVCICIMKQ